MKKPKITEGQWEYCEMPHEVNGALFSLTIGVFMDGRIIKIGSGNSNKYLNEFKANATAISAVPDMIDALIEARKDLSIWVKEFEGCGANLLVTRRVIQKIDQALKKAGCTDE